jgi:uncharacterized protein with von Willebrand factor type A (vWA) domain
LTAGQGVSHPVPIAAAGDALVGQLSQLAAAMRERGARLGLRELLTAVRCLDAVDGSSREDARLALRVVLCSRQSDLGRFDEAFTEVFGTGWVPRTGDVQLSELGSIERAALPRAAFGDPQAARAPGDGAEPVPAAWSALELLIEKDFGRYTEAEMALAYALMARLARRHPMRLSRRTRQ